MPLSSRCEPESIAALPSPHKMHWTVSTGSTSSSLIHSHDVGLSDDARLKLQVRVPACTVTLRSKKNKKINKAHEVHLKLSFEL